MRGTNHASDHTLKLIPKDTVGIELGVWKGNTSAKFLTKTKHLYLVDAWSIEAYKESSEWDSYEHYLKIYSKLTGGKDEESFKQFYDQIYADVCERFKNDPVTIFREPTKKFFEHFNEKVDWIYVDADHSYEGVQNDIAQSFKLLKPDGVIFGDDYHFSKIQVQKGINNFKKES